MDILSYHDLFRLLQGNPTSLNRAANVYLNPFNEVQSLLDLYKSIKQSSNATTGDAAELKGRIDDLRPKPRLNNESIQAMTKLAIDMLRSEEAKSLLYFLGCLPAGVMRGQLEEMWGSQKVTAHLPCLQQMNLVEQSDQFDLSGTRYELSPVLCQFISQDIEETSKQKCMNLIIKHYALAVQKVYKKASALELEADLVHEDVLEDASPVATQTKCRWDDSAGSIDFEQLSKGLDKKSFQGKKRILANLGLVKV